eukprot:CAMPEP_0118923218 /NCGR_PEP_ID=MMETSP1169-20130426/1828_1 /TAXON_ID=36882 /ORGANISM="Pyramimonas obovata, Strain CCMP722" /LENGTH=186 /DNA_ID=CAMNT_0006864179 /DNA_START=283 /DNA_END=843 /DNA_ORIENTATION=-
MTTTPRRGMRFVDSTEYTLVACLTNSTPATPCGFSVPLTAHAPWRFQTTGRHFLMSGPLCSRASLAMTPTHHPGTLTVDQRGCCVAACQRHTTHATSLCLAVPEIVHILGPGRMGETVLMVSEVVPVFPFRNRASQAKTPNPCCGTSVVDWKGCRLGACLTYSTPANPSGLLAQASSCTLWPLQTV